MANSSYYHSNKKIPLTPFIIFSCITNMKTRNHDRHTTIDLLNDHMQLHTRIESLAHEHVLPLTHKQPHHYSLTFCVCPGKGVVEEWKQFMKCEMTNTW